MVYADVPEHEGLAEGKVSEKAPRPISTDGWLERISDQLQVFVDKLEELNSDEDDETPDGDTGDGDGATSTVTVTEPAKDDGDKSGATSPAVPEPAKKTTAAKRP